MKRAMVRQVQYIKSAILSHVMSCPLKLVRCVEHSSSDHHQDILLADGKALDVT